MKKSKILGILTLIVFIALITTIIITLKFSNIPEENCKIDSDCVKIQTTCCSCSMGGKEKCAGKSEIEDYKEELEKCPKNPVCIALYNCNDKGCKCINNTCVEI